MPVLFWLLGIPIPLIILYLVLRGQNKRRNWQGASSIPTTLGTECTISGMASHGLEGRRARQAAGLRQGIAAAAGSPRYNTVSKSPRRCVRQVEHGSPDAFAPGDLQAANSERSCTGCRILLPCGTQCNEIANLLLHALDRGFGSFASSSKQLISFCIFTYKLSD